MTGSDIYAKNILSTDDKPSGAFPGQLIIEQDTGDVFEWTGASWQEKAVAGATNVAVQNLDLGIDIEVGHGKDLEVASDTIASATTTEAIAAGGTGIVTYVYGVKITGISSVINRITIKDDTTQVDTVNIQSVGDALCGYIQNVTPDGYLFKSTANKAINIITSSAESIDYQLLYWQE